ncbi:MAG: tetratricopeptide repeat protein, partial [Candidatus Omnitrophica bacterium]|nr:tetratricopeptide repeat protein [Candidatus Omnitrophota bacterium]
MRKCVSKNSKLLFAVGILIGFASLSSRVVFAGNEQSARELVNKADKADTEGKYDDAISYASQAMEIKSDMPEAYFERGVAYWHKNQKDLFPKAIEDFNRAIGLKPDYSDAYKGRGIIESKMDLYDADIQDQSMSLKLNPHQADAYFNRGYSYYNKGMYSESIADYNHSLEIDRDANYVYRERGNAYYRTGNYDLAIQDFDKALKVNPQDSATYWYRARVYLKKKEYDLAISDCCKSLQIKSTRSDAYVTRGDAYRHKGQYDLAINDYNKAIELKPDQHGLGAYFGRGLAHKAKGESKEASDDLRKAVALNPGNETYLKELAKLGNNTVSQVPISQPTDIVSQPADVVSPIMPAANQNTRILAMFTGYAVADSCGQANIKAAGIPWGADASKDGEPLNSAQLGQYQLMLHHAMQDLRVLYGPLSDQEDKKFNAFWAPFFDHPTSGALGYFQQIIPLMDETLVTLTNIDGLLPAMGEALQGTLLAGGEPYNSAARIAAVRYQAIKAQRKHLEDLTQKISRLGNPPNPLAAKCAAHTRHRKVMAVNKKKEEEPQEANLDFVKQHVQKINADVTAIFAEAAARQKNDLMIRPELVYKSQGVKCQSAVIKGEMTEEQCNAQMAEGKAELEAYDKQHALASAVVAPTRDQSQSPDGQQVDQTKPQTIDPENDPKINAEAVAEHLALAEQIQREADRWAADAAKEKDPVRKLEMIKRAEAIYTNAQAEKDIAASLQTGIIVHTRTPWDDYQQQALISSMKNEVAHFAVEDKLIANIPKVSDMIAGLEGVQLREGLQQRIEDALSSPDRTNKLAAIYVELHNKVVDQGYQQIAGEFDKVQMWDNRLALAEDVEMAAGLGITLGALWAPAQVGSLALGYAGSTGFAEDGLKGAAVNVGRGVSSKIDVVVSAYEGAVKIDPKTKKPAGFWGAVEGALWSMGTNKAFEVIGGKIQKAKAEYALARQAEGGRGFAAVSRAGEGRLKEYDFKTPEERYRAEIESATTPEQQDAVNKKYAIQVKREAMNNEMEAARQKAVDSIRQGKDPNKAKEDYNKDLQDINDKYSESEKRNDEH